MRSWCRVERQIVIKRLLIDMTRLLLVLQQRLNFGSESDTSMVDAVVERLDTDAVTNQPQLSLFRVPQRDGKHATKLVHAFDTPFLERMQNHFGVGMVRLPAVSAASLEFCANFGMVVNLTIEDHPKRAILIAHRLHGSFR